MTNILSNPLGVAVALVGGVLLLTLVVRLGLAARRANRVQVATWGLGIPAAMALAMSASTSYRFFGTALSVTDQAERMALCGSGEAFIIGLTLHAWAAKSRASAWAVYVLVGVQAIPAFEVSGGAGGIVRMVLGPIMLAFLLHKLLGIETKFSGSQSTGLLAAAGREIRERIVSRLGIGRRGADSAEIARSRAADRAVRLATRKRWGRRAFDRLADAIDAAQHGLAPDAAAVAEAAVVARIVRRQSVMDLRRITGGHVWSTTAVSGTAVFGAPVLEIAGPDTDEDTEDFAEPVVSGWTGARASVRRRPGRRPRHLRPTPVHQARQAAPEQPQPVYGPVRVDTVEAEPTVPSQGGKRRPSVRPAVIALRAQNPDMATDTIAEILGVAERTVTRHLSASSSSVQHANGAPI